MNINYTNLYDKIDNSIYNLNKTLIENICNELKQSNKIPYFINKYLKNTNVKKKYNNTTHNIKKNKSAYMFFTDEVRPKLQQKFPNDKLGQISKRLGKLWNDLKIQDKKKYEKKALQDKKRYEIEINNHNTPSNNHNINNDACNANIIQDYAINDDASNDDASNDDASDNDASNDDVSDDDASNDDVSDDDASDDDASDDNCEDAQTISEDSDNIITRYNSDRSSS